MKKFFATSKENVHSILPRLVLTGKTVSIKAKKGGKVYHIREVPASQFDVVIFDVPGHGTIPERDVYWIVEVNPEKKGCFDGKSRTRVVITPRGSREIKTIGSLPDQGDIFIDEPFNGSVRVKLDQQTMSFRSLNADISNFEEVGRIVYWHANRYFRHLLRTAKEEIDAYAKTFHPDKERSLAEVNREVSNYLYKLSRDLGFRKLTAREKQAVGLSGGSWILVSDYEAAKLEARRNMGIGDFTLRSSLQHMLK